jgi:tetratricopeptide (TPR) repeat protein
MRLQLGELYKGKWGRDTELLMWIDLVDRYPYEEPIRNKLAKALKQARNMDYELKVWAELVQKHSDNVFLLILYAQACRRQVRMNIVSQDATHVRKGISLLEELVDSYSHEPILQKELNGALRATRDKNNGIEVWKRLVNKHPHSFGLQVELRMACEAKGDLEEALAMWRDLVDKHPEQRGLLCELRLCCRKSNRGSVELWDLLVNNHPNEPGIRKEQRWEAEREMNCSRTGYARILNSGGKT